MRNHWFGRLLLVLAVLLVAPAVADHESLFGAEISVICYGKQNTWIRFAGKSYDIPQSVVTLLQTKGEFSDASGAEITEDAELKELFEHADSVFRGQSYDCILAFPACFSYRDRLQTVQLLGTHVANVRISTMSEIAALGYNHYHLPLEKTKGQYTNKVFVVINDRYVSATLAGLGDIGVVTVHGSVGALVPGELPEIQGYVQSAVQAIRMLSDLPKTSKYRYDEVVISGTHQLEAIVDGLKASSKIRVPVSGFKQLVTKGLLTQSAMLHGSAQTKVDLLLVAMPHSSLGVVLPVDAVTSGFPRVGINSTKRPPGVKETEPSDSLLIREGIDLKVSVSSGPHGGFIEVMPPFATIPAERRIELQLSETPRHILVAEHTGRSVLSIQKLPWSRDATVSDKGGRVEILFEIDADMMLTVTLKNLEGGPARKHRITFDLEQGAPAAADKPRR